ncbi:MAG: SRPBCC family protein [Proteobacteria bacterium]|nr:SRPBCC family protein [Pseudomonadota bacterium]
MSTAQTRFVYVTYIRTTPEKLWAALTQSEFTKQYWFGVTLESDWKPGSDWKLAYDDGRIMDAGSIVEADAPRRLVIKWRNEWKPEFKAEGYSRCTMEIEQTADSVKLSVIHEMDAPNSAFINEGVSTGWPKILSNLKSLLETGSVLMPEKV